jgi:polysaccharide biosynthesis protein PslJ
MTVVSRQSSRRRNADKPWISALRRVFPSVRFASPALPLFTTYLALLFLIPSSLIFLPLGGIGTPAVVLSLAILLWYIASWVAGKVVPSGAGRPMRHAMIAFGAAALASFVAAMTRDITSVEALSADRALILVIAWAGLVVVVSQSITRYDQLETLMRRAVLFGCIVAAIGILEFFVGINITNYIQIPGLSPNITYSTLLSRGSFNRPSSTAVDPIEFSVVMAMLLPFALQQALDISRTGWLRKWCPVVLLAFAIPVGVSRSGIVGAAVVLVVLAPTWKARQRRGLLAASVVGLGVLKVAAPGLIGTLYGYFAGLFGTSSEGSVESTRVSAFSLDWPYIAARPIFGRGWGTFLPQVYSWTDDMYLLSLISIGVAGLLCLLLIFLAGIRCGVRGRRNTQDQQRRAFGQALVASIAVAAVTSATFDSLGFPMFAGLLFLILGIAGAYDGIIFAEQDALSELLSLTESY